MRGKKEIISKNPNSLILIKTNQTEKVKGILEREKVSYEIYNSETNLKTKSSPKSKNVKELINSSFVKYAYGKTKPRQYGFNKKGEGEYKPRERML